MSRYAVEFRRVTRADFAVLSRWLATPAVARWWNHEWSPVAVERDFGPSVDGTEPNQDWLALLDGRPVGLLQRSRVEDYERNRRDFAALVEVPDGALTIDDLLGDPESHGKGLGSAMIAAFVSRSFVEFPDAPAVLVSVVAANIASWRALEKAGFRRVAEGDLEPDNPVDDPLHHVLRRDRPVADLAVTAWRGRSSIG
ncbi:MAG: GNAT family N-acetyltransferase [Pedococcus sp.]